MKLLWKAYKDHDVSKEMLNEVIHIHHDAVMSGNSYDQTKGEIMYRKAESNKLLIGDLSAQMIMNL